MLIGLLSIMWPGILIISGITGIDHEGEKDIFELLPNNKTGWW
jgi:hypothetical protein